MRRTSPRGNAYGTSIGIEAVASGGHGHTENEPRYVRRRYLPAEVARVIAVNMANATFAARSTDSWGARPVGDRVRHHEVAELLPAAQDQAK
ncbi:hypothetical protein [Streptomyces poonensis]|uniref:Uncharacterized protein n=1 Tax=Streptomyces poonensis TaxID=68255 RepID=A0A918UEU9_9ACTN|nr:hypothetical protein [Streptomyces poonensis]GGY97525.1 hypothetical protein GCM10010365_14960 [Streptomyces poonensis]